MAYAQSVSGSADSAAFLSLTLPNPVVSGSCLVLDVVYEQTHGYGSPAINPSGFVSVSLGLPNEYGSTGLKVASYYLQSAPGGTTTVVIAKALIGDPDFTHISAALHEYANISTVSALDPLVSGSGGQYSPWETDGSVSVTLGSGTTYDNEILHAFAVNAPGQPINESFGFVLRELVGGSATCWMHTVDMALTQKHPATPSVAFAVLQSQYPQWNPAFPYFTGNVVLLGTDLWEALTFVPSGTVPSSGPYWTPYTVSLSPFICVMMALKSTAPPPPPTPTPGAGWISIVEPGTAGVDRTGYLTLQGTHTHTRTMRNRGTAQITLFIAAGDPYLPEGDPLDLVNFPSFVGCQVYMWDQNLTGYTLVFAGTIDTLETTWLDDVGNRTVSLGLVTLDQCLDVLRVPPGLAYTYWKAEDIFRDLFSRVCAGVPLLLGTVSAPDPLDPSLSYYLKDTLASNWERVSDDFKSLAQAAQCIMGIDLTSLASPSLYMKPIDTTLAPFVLASDQIVWESATYEQNRQDYRNRQIIRISPDAFGNSDDFFNLGTVTFPVTVFLQRPASKIMFAWLTDATRSSATGTFSANPSDGEQIVIGYPTSGSAYNWAANTPVSSSPATIIVDPAGNIQKCTTSGITGDSIADIVNPGTAEPGYAPGTGFNGTIGGTCSDGPGTYNGVTGPTAIWTNQGPSGPGGLNSQVYTFRNAANFDNTQWGHVLIGANAAATAQNLADAINRNDATAGQGFSWPTWENPLVNADPPYGSATIKVWNKAAGSTFKASLVGSVSFTWSGTGTSGGADSTVTESLQIAENGSSNTANLYYTPGSATVSLASPPSNNSHWHPSGSQNGNLQIEYQRYGGDCIVVERSDLVIERANAENGTGKYQQLVTDTSVTSNTLGYQLVYATLAAYSPIPVMFRFRTFIPGLDTGMLLKINVVQPGTGGSSATGLGPLVNFARVGGWVVQEVEARLIPTKTYLDPEVPGGGHYEYTVSVIDVAQIASYLEFWNGLGGGSGGGGGLVGGGGGLLSSNTPLVPGNEGYYTVTPGLNGIAVVDLANGFYQRIVLTGTTLDGGISAGATSLIVNTTVLDNTACLVGGGGFSFFWADGSGETGYCTAISGMTWTISPAAHSHSNGVNIDTPVTFAAPIYTGGTIAAGIPRLVLYQDQDSVGGRWGAFFATGAGAYALGTGLQVTVSGKAGTRTTVVLNFVTVWTYEGSSTQESIT